MANTIKIKRSTTTATPPSLAEGELAYSEASNNLFIGTSGGNIENIGGKIGVTVQGYNANTVIDASYVHTDNNYTTTEKTKLSGIEAGAEVNVNADWNAVSGDAQILNKPTLATVATTGSYNDLLNKPTITNGTVTSVGLSVPTGLSVSGTPVTTSGTIAVTLTSGYAIPTTAKQTQWDSAYTWYQTMTTPDADAILNTWSELVTSLNNAGESVNILNNGSTIDGGTF